MKELQQFLNAIKEKKSTTEIESLLTPLLKVMDINDLRDPITGYTPLHLAVDCDRLDLVQLFSDTFPNLVDSRSKDGSTAVFLAIFKGQIKTVQHLMEKGACITIANAAGQNCFDLTAKLSPDHPLYFFNEHKEEIFKQINANLIDAICEGQIDEVEQWLIKGAHVDSLMNSSELDTLFTPFTYACSIGNKPLAELLLLYGANINAVCAKNGRTPLHYATYFTHRYIVSLLMQLHAQIIPDKEGITPLAIAQKQNISSIIGLLNPHSTSSTSASNSAHNSANNSANSSPLASPRSSTSSLSRRNSNSRTRSSSHLERSNSGTRSSLTPIATTSTLSSSIAIPKARFSPPASSVSTPSSSPRSSVSSSSSPSPSRLVGSGHRFLNQPPLSPEIRSMADFRYLIHSLNQTFVLVEKSGVGCIEGANKKHPELNLKPIHLEHFKEIMGTLRQHLQSLTRDFFENKASGIIEIKNTSCKWSIDICILSQTIHILNTFLTDRILPDPGYAKYFKNLYAGLKTFEISTRQLSELFNQLVENQMELVDEIKRTSSSSEPKLPKL